MPGTETFTDQLTAILEKTARWRKDAEVVKALAEKVAANRAVSEQQLLSVEQISTAVYSEIPVFDKIVADHGAPSELEAAMVTHVGDALRLLSLELTELSTKMYAAHSAWALDDGTRTEPAEVAEDSVWR